MSTNTTQCTIIDKPEFYGLGIRISFYLLWFGLTIARWIHDPNMFLVLLGTHFMFACSVFFGLIAGLANSAGLSAAEVYLDMLFVSGLACYARIPYYTWRVATAFRAELDSGFYYYHLGLRERMQEMGPSIFAFLETGLMACTIAVQLWFWCVGVESASFHNNGKDSTGQYCELQQQVGFVFRPAELRSPGFRAFNSILMFAVMGGTIVVELAEQGCISSEGGSSRRARRRRRCRRLQNIGEKRKSDLKNLQTACDLVVTPIIIAAIELTITWNNIPNTGHAQTPAQLIPLLVGVILFTMVIAQLFWPESPDEDSEAPEDGDDGTDNTESASYRSPSASNVAATAGPASGSGSYASSAPKSLSPSAPEPASHQEPPPPPQTASRSRSRRGGPDEGR